MKEAQEDKKTGATKEKTPASKAPQDRKERLVKAYESAASHFKKVADKVRGRSAQGDKEKEVKMGRAKVKPLQNSNADRAAEHSKKEKAASIRKTGEGQAKNRTETKTKQAAPRPVVIKK